MRHPRKVDRTGIGDAALSLPVAVLLGVTVVVAGCAGSTEPADPAATILEATTPTDLIGTVATDVSPAPAVRVRNQDGTPATGVVVRFELAPGSGTVANTSVETDLNGTATVGTWTLGTAAGIHTVTARSAGLLDVLFRATACDDSCSELQLLFVRDGRLYLTDLAGGTPRQLDNGSGQDAEPAWSPDGARIAFVRYDPPGSANGDLYLMYADGSAAVRRAAGFRFPAWSPDGRQLAVNRGDCHYYCDVYLLSAANDETSPRLVASQAAHPAWSPDGRKIAFVRLSGDDGYHVLAVMNPDGSEISEITLLDQGAIAHPTWSPDGRRIAFSKCIAGRCNIFTVSADASALPHSALTQLTTVGNAGEPAWSPDGIWIAFTLWDDYESSIAYVAADGGGDPIPLVANGYSTAFRPWPQGAR